MRSGVRRRATGRAAMTGWRNRFAAPAWLWIKTVVSGFLDNNCSIHAAGLTYFSLLALVPILCIGLMAAKGFNADELVRRHIDRQIDTLITYIEEGQNDELARIAATGDEKALEVRKAMAAGFGKEARNLSNTIFERIDKFDMGTLGWIGFVALLWTVVSSIGMVEQSFNEIWGVPKPRPVWKRAFLYISVVIILPVVGALAMSLPLLNIAKNLIVTILGATWLTEWVSAGLIRFLDSWVFRMCIAMTFATLDFAFLFAALPNCRVDFKCALRGGAITAVLFGGWLKLCAVAQIGVAKSSALYGSFAFFPIVLAWIYMSWQILLLGANMVRAFEKVDSMQGARLPEAA